MNGDASNPPDMESIMATALLAFSRQSNENIYNQIEAQEIVQVTDPQPAIRDIKPQFTSSPDMNLQYQLALQQAVVHAATSAAQNNFLCGTVPTHPVGGLETLHTNIVMEHAKAAALLNGTFCFAPESLVSLSKVPPVTLGTQNFVPKGTSSTEQTVRQKEIEEALRSKSQRGRKRANLNEIERLLKITFASKISDKMKSVEVITLQRSRDYEEVSPFRQNLDEQISHPSVISLDAERDPQQRGQPPLSDDEKQMDSDDGMCPSMIF